MEGSVGAPNKESAMKQDTMEDMVLNIEQTVVIKAPAEKVFEGLIHHLCNMEGEAGKPGLKLKLERRPGGRWYRDLGSDSGHLWGFVQSIKPPTLLEIFGPLMMSYPVANNLIVRLSPAAEGTQLLFKHQVFGPLPAEYSQGMDEGWGQMLNALKTDLER
jgi:uncharacterized protein YndB with AHSA1/START domain